MLSFEGAEVVFGIQELCDKFLCKGEDLYVALVDLENTFDKISSNA